MFESFHFLERERERDSVKTSQDSGHPYETFLLEVNELGEAKRGVLDRFDFVLFGTME